MTREEMIAIVAAIKVLEGRDPVAAIVHADGALRSIGLKWGEAMPLSSVRPTALQETSRDPGEAELRARAALEFAQDMDREALINSARSAVGWFSSPRARTHDERVAALERARTVLRALRENECVEQAVVLERELAIETGVTL